MQKCIDVCSANTVKESHKDGNTGVCLGKLKYFAKAHNVGQYIRWLCVSVRRP